MSNRAFLLTAKFQAYQSWLSLLLPEYERINAALVQGRPGELFGEQSYYILSFKGMAPTADGVQDWGFVVQSNKMGNVFTQLDCDVDGSFLATVCVYNYSPHPSWEVEGVPAIDLKSPLRSAYMKDMKPAVFDPSAFSDAVSSINAFTQAFTTKWFENCPPLELLHPNPHNQKLPIPEHPNPNDWKNIHPMPFEGFAINGLYIDCKRYEFGGRLILYFEERVFVRVFYAEQYSSWVTAVQKIAQMFGVKVSQGKSGSLILSISEPTSSAKYSARALADLAVWEMGYKSRPKYSDLVTFVAEAAEPESVRITFPYNPHLCGISIEHIASALCCYADLVCSSSDRINHLLAMKHLFAVWEASLDSSVHADGVDQEVVRDFISFCANFVGFPLAGFNKEEAAE